jgi:hypothetical protein
MEIWRVDTEVCNVLHIKIKVRGIAIARSICMRINAAHSLAQDDDAVSVPARTLLSGE